MPGGQDEEHRQQQVGSPFVPLPGNLGDPRDEARKTFDAVAGLYDRARPGYPCEALVELASRCGLGPQSRVLEVGCGTGQATCDLARTGASIECLEPGHALAELARTNLAELRNVRVHTTNFETLAEQSGCYDAVVSATAFHWIAPTSRSPRRPSCWSRTGRWPS